MKVEYDELIKAASDLLDKRYNPPTHSVAAALRLQTGEIVTALNADHFSGFICAETAALSRALNDNKYHFDSIVAVRKDGQSTSGVANMCGKCRQIFHDYAPNIKIIIDNGKALEARTVEELLPFSFARQRVKIQASLEK